MEQDKDQKQKQTEPQYLPLPNVFKPAELIAEAALEHMKNYEQFAERVLHCLQTRKERSDPYTMRTEKHGILKFNE